MTKYPNGACEAHRNVETSEPVCIICMVEEIEQLRTLAKASLDARDKEAKAARSYENARNNFSQDTYEAKAYEKAMIAASMADKALRDALNALKEK